MRFAVWVTGSDTTTHILREFGINAVNARPAFDAALQKVQSETDRMWAGGRTPLKPSTRARKRRMGQTPQPLVGDGDTRKAVRPIKVATTGRTARITVAPPQSAQQMRRGRPVIPPTRRIVSLTYEAIYDHLNVEPGSVRRR